MQSIPSSRSEAGIFASFVVISAIAIAAGCGEGGVSERYHQRRCGSNGVCITVEVTSGPASIAYVTPIYTSAPVPSGIYALGVGGTYYPVPTSTGSGSSAVGG